MDNIKRIGIKYIKASSFFILFLLILYIFFAIGGLMHSTFYTTWGLISYIFVQILLPIYGGLLLFFILYLFAEFLSEYFYKTESGEMEKESHDEGS